MANFRIPGRLGRDEVMLPTGATLARYPSFAPGTVGSESSKFSHRPLTGDPAIEMSAAGVGANRSTKGPRIKVQIDPQRMAQYKAIEALPSQSNDFGFEGQIYRVIHATAWRQLASSARYRIVPQDEAQVLLQRMLVNLAVSRAHRAAYQGVLDFIGEPRTGPSANGLLLLRVAPISYAKATSTAPVVTPSQLKALRDAAKTHWITIRLVDEEGNPVVDEPYMITTPDNVEHTGSTDESGFGHLDGIIEGQCKVCFPNRDRDVWSNAG